MDDIFDKVGNRPGGTSADDIAADTTAEENAIIYDDPGTQVDVIDFNTIAGKNFIMYNGPGTPTDIIAPDSKAENNAKIQSGSDTFAAPTAADSIAENNPTKHDTVGDKGTEARLSGERKRRLKHCIVFSDDQEPEFDDAINANKQMSACSLATKIPKLMTSTEIPVKNQSKNKKKFSSQLPMKIRKRAAKHDILVDGDSTNHGIQFTNISKLQLNKMQKIQFNESVENNTDEISQNNAVIHNDIVFASKATQTVMPTEDFIKIYCTNRPCKWYRFLGLIYKAGFITLDLILSLLQVLMVFLIAYGIMNHIYGAIKVVTTKPTNTIPAPKLNVSIKRK